jgi:hypothetical protein
MSAMVLCHHICHADEYAYKHRILMGILIGGEYIPIHANKKDFIYYLLCPITSHGISRPGKDHTDQATP